MIKFLALRLLLNNIKYFRYSIIIIHENAAYKCKLGIIALFQTLLTLEISFVYLFI